MRRGGKIAAGAAAATLVLAAGYGSLDAAGVVPGILTTADAPRPPVPLPGRTEIGPGVGAPTPGRIPAQDPVVEGAVPASGGVRAAVVPLLASPALGPTTAAVVRDVATGRHLLDVDADTPHVPASVTKLVSAFAVAHTLDPESTLKTTVVTGAPGHVVLEAGGDTAIAPGAGNPDEVAGRAGMADLAAQVARSLRAQGVRSVVVDRDLSYAPGPAAPPGWDVELLDLGFATRVGMLGLSTDRSKPGTAAPADPAGNAVAAFVAQLTRQGVTATVGGAATAAPGATRLGQVESAPVIDVLGLALRDSDNAMIESLARQAAARQGVPGDTPSVVAWVMRVLRAQGVDVDGVALKDTSGLSEGSLMPARLLTDLLQRGASGSDPRYQAVISRLPVSGWNGTLHDRFRTGAGAGGAGWVRAKTGSLPDVSSLAGTVLTRDGRLLVFAVINNGEQPGGAVATKAAVDAIAARLAACGCR